MTWPSGGVVRKSSIRKLPIERDVSFDQRLWTHCDRALVPEQKLVSCLVYPIILPFFLFLLRFVWLLFLSLFFFFFLFLFFFFFFLTVSVNGRCEYTSDLIGYVCSKVEGAKRPNTRSLGFIPVCPRGDRARILGVGNKKRVFPH